ncbi:hypothetical protein [Gordonia sp. (in: high G+C Gram-positive bacteria)]|uniref:hypothetical protein n=1 Tax=Gordonia sp. (in: high G+C Gram-positive bacteria) TaxID=84139 RepID=UPI003C757266
MTIYGFVATLIFLFLIVWTLYEVLAELAADRKPKSGRPELAEWHPLLVSHGNLLNPEDRR